MSFYSNNSARRSRQRGFGLLEAVICISLMSLIFLGAMTMIITAGRSVVRTQSQVYATGDAANSIQYVIGQLREASAFALPTSSTAQTAETTWNPMGGLPLGHFSTTMANGETINTAIQVTTPPTLTPQANGYTVVPPVPSLRVLSTTGGYWEASVPGGPFHPNWPLAPYNVQASGGVGVSDSVVTLIYRGDPDGTPDADPTGNADPKAGTYLWQYTLPPDSSFNPANYPNSLVALCKSVSTAPNAVQFVRAVYGGIPEQNQVEVKIISSYYSPVNGQQTSEEGSGASSSQLSGKCVYMRDHYTGSVDTKSSTQSSNNVFQYH
jgi:type II secretory pathway pseudopilin PulG